MSPLLEAILAELRADPIAGREFLAELVKLASDLVHDQPRPELLTVRQAAELASVSEKTIRRKIDDGEIVATRIGTSVRVRRAELDRYLEGSAQRAGRAQLGRRRTHGGSSGTVAAAFRALDRSDPGQ